MYYIIMRVVRMYDYKDNTIGKTIDVSFLDLQ